MTYRRWGVLCKKLRPYKSAGHNIRKTEPKVHILIYRRTQKVWVKACQPNNMNAGYTPRGEVVDDATEVTCKLCLGTNYDKVEHCRARKKSHRTSEEGTE